MAVSGAGSQVGSVSGVIWEWQRKDGGFSPFPPHLSQEIEAAYHSGGTPSSTFNAAGHGKLDFNARVIRNSSRRGEHKVQRSAVSLPTAPLIHAYWTWNEGSAFVVYTMDATVDLELAYQQYLCGSSGGHTVDLSACSSRIPYTIDFSTMTQTRHQYQTQRRIQRELIPNGSSLQSLLAPPTQSTTPHTTPGATGASCLASGPATYLLRSGVRRGRSAATGTTTKTSGVTSFSAPATNSGTGSLATAPLTTTAGGGGASSSGSTKKTSSRKGGRGKKKSPPLGRRANTDSEETGSALPDYVTIVKTLSPGDNEPCPICMCELSEQSGYSDEGVAVMPPVPYLPPVDLCKLRKCGHMMHRPCFLMMMKSESAKNGLMCPTCKKVYGTRTGDMPDSGTMTVSRSSRSLPGHPGCSSIVIVYNFSPGISNGRHFNTYGFPRTCYLPDSPKGQKVLRLLRVAWERRLTFTIGTSVTSGATDTVVWNEIHHKTESSSNHSGHGFPDPNYLDNVLMELSLQGVTEDSDSSTSDDSL